MMTWYWPVQWRMNTPKAKACCQWKRCRCNDPAMRRFGFYSSWKYIMIPDRGLSHPWHSSWVIGEDSEGIWHIIFIMKTSNLDFLRWRLNLGMWTGQEGNIREPSRNDSLDHVLLWNLGCGPISWNKSRPDPREIKKKGHTDTSDASTSSSSDSVVMIYW